MLNSFMSTSDYGETFLNWLLHVTGYVYVDIIYSYDHVYLCLHIFMTLDSVALMRFSLMTATHIMDHNTIRKEKIASSFLLMFVFIKTKMRLSLTFLPERVFVGEGGSK